MNFFMKMLLKQQLKGVPEAEVDKLIGLVENNPEFFKSVAEKVEKKIKTGMGQQEAVMAVLSEGDNQEELKKMMR